MNEVRICTDVDAFLQELQSYARAVSEGTPPSTGSKQGLLGTFRRELQEFAEGAVHHKSQLHEQDFQRYVMNSLTVAGQMGELDAFLNSMSTEFGVCYGTIWRWASGASNPIAGMRRVFIVQCAAILPKLREEARRKQREAIAWIRSIG